MRKVAFFGMVAVLAAVQSVFLALAVLHSPWWFLGLWAVSSVAVALIVGRFIRVGMGGQSAGSTAMSAPAVFTTRDGIPVGYIPIGPRPNSWTPFGPLMGDTPYRVGRKGVSPWFSPVSAPVPGPAEAADDDDDGQDGDGGQLGDGDDDDRPPGKPCGVCGIVHSGY